MGKCPPDLAVNSIRTWFAVRSRNFYLLKSGTIEIERFGWARTDPDQPFLWDIIIFHFSKLTGQLGVLNVARAKGTS